MNRHVIALATLTLSSAPVIADEATTVDWTVSGYDASYAQGVEDNAAMKLDLEEPELEGVPWMEEGPFLPRQPDLAGSGEQRPGDMQN